MNMNLVFRYVLHTFMLYTISDFVVFFRKLIYWVVSTSPAIVGRLL